MVRVLFYIKSKMSNIITADTLNTYTGKILDANVAANAVSGANAYVESLTHRYWGDTNTVTGERHDWGSTLWLNQMDVIDVTAVVLGWPGFPDQSTLPSTAYFNDEYGRVTLFWQQLNHSVPTMYRNDYISVDYTYGVTTVPDDLIEATHGVALSIYNWIKAGGNQVVSSSVGSLRLEYAGAVRGSNTGPTPYKDVSEAHYMTIKSYAKQRV